MNLLKLMKLLNSEKNGEFAKFLSNSLSAEQKNQIISASKQMLQKESEQEQAKQQVLGKRDFSQVREDFEKRSRYDDIDQ